MKKRAVPPPKEKLAHQILPSELKIHGERSRGRIFYPPCAADRGRPARRGCGSNLTAPSCWINDIEARATSEEFYDAKVKVLLGAD
jgi:hypothetical protein